MTEAREYYEMLSQGHNIKQGQFQYFSFSCDLEGLTTHNVMKKIHLSMCNIVPCFLNLSHLEHLGSGINLSKLPACYRHIPCLWECLYPDTAGTQHLSSPCCVQPEPDHHILIRQTGGQSPPLCQN